MTLASTATANDILNRVASEVGLDQVTKPFDSTDTTFIQMKTLLQTAGEKLAKFQWEFLEKEFQVTTKEGDSGTYDLPDDFGTMINQSGWERSENVPLFGPLSSQDWTYLKGRDLVSFTIYASFRIREGKFMIFPEPPPIGLDINFEYRSNGWVQDSTTPTLFKQDIEKGEDILLYDRTLIISYLKARWLGAKGFDNREAMEDFNLLFETEFGLDKGAEILSVGRNARNFPYLDARYNSPDTGYGSSS